MKIAGNSTNLPSISCRFALGNLAPTSKSAIAPPFKRPQDRLIYPHSTGNHNTPTLIHSVIAALFLQQRKGLIERYNNESFS